MASAGGVYVGIASAFGSAIGSGITVGRLAISLGGFAGQIAWRIETTKQAKAVQELAEKK